MADNVYEMMAKIGLDSTLLMAGLAAIGLKLTSLHGNVEALSIAFKGLGAALAAKEIIDGFEKIAKAGGEVNHQINMMKSVGMTTAEQADAMAKAKDVAFKVPTTHISENLKHLQELRYIFGGASEANEYIEQLSRMNSVINNIKGGGKDQIFDLAKSLEIKNLTTDPKEFMSYADAMLKTIQSSGGRVTAESFRNAVQYGRISAMTWDKDFMSGPLGRMIQEYSSGSGGGGGSGGPGNALMSMSAAVIRGTMTKPSAAIWKDMGFGDVRHRGVDEEHGRSLMQRNPYEWVQQFLVPALAAKGITDNEAINSKIQEMFGVRTAAGIVANMATGGRAHVPGVNAEGHPNSPYEKDIALSKIAEGQNSYDRLIKEDYPMIMKAFNEQWNNLLQTLGSDMMAPGGPVIKGMSSMVEALSSLGKFFSDNPKVADALLVAMAGLAAAFAGFAVASIITVMGMLAPGALIPLAIVGLVGALGTLAGLNWDKLKSTAEGIGYLATTLGNAMRMLGMLPRSTTSTNPNIHNQSFEGVGPSGPRLMPANFTPGEKKQVLQPIQMTLNMDGRTLAQAVSEILEDLYQHPTAAASANGWNNFRSSDSNYTST